MLTLCLQHIFKFFIPFIPFKNEKKVVGYSLGAASIFPVIGRGVLSQCKGCSFQNFPWDANYKMNEPRIVKVFMSMFGAGDDYMARSVLPQSRRSLRKICCEVVTNTRQIFNFVTGR